MQNRDTIFALATGAGRAGVAILRISGNGAHQVLSKFSRQKLPQDRIAVVRKLFASDGELLDEALVLKFSAPRSFTGEDMVELHVHGGEAVIDGVSRALFTLGVAQAEPGEFTKRAFGNGRLDLTEAEGLADLIDAKSDKQKRQALMQMGGGLKVRYEQWRAQIIELLAKIEGELDFPDEGDVPSNLAETAGQGLETLANDLKMALKQGRRGERIRHGLDITVIGAPNAGKSSIINGLGGRDVAIVSGVAGTTRDIVEVHMELGGLPVRLSDTAGLRETDNAIEQEGVRRALARAGESDLKIGVVDLQSPEQLEDLLPLLGPDDILVLNKMDCLNENELDIVKNVSRETCAREDYRIDETSIITMSATKGAGLSALEEILEARIKTLYALGEVSSLTRARHYDCVERALRCVQNARQSLEVSAEVSGAELVGALHALKELAGETDIEAVLDRIFSSFCIGK